MYSVYLCLVLWSRVTATELVLYVTLYISVCACIGCVCVYIGCICVRVQGVFVSRVAEQSHCYRAGLRVGDKLVSVILSFQITLIIIIIV